MSGLLAAGLIAAVTSAGLFGIAAVLQAWAVRGLGEKTDSLGWLVINMWRQPTLMVVVAAYIAGFFLHALAIWWLPLYLAQAAISLSLPITAAVAARRLDEPVGAVGWTAVAGIIAGIGFLAAGSGFAGETRHSELFTLALWLGAILLTFAGMTGWVDTTAGLGALAGFGYAGSAIAVRGVADLSSTSVLSALAVPVYGSVAFWLYSMAMDRGDVATASGLVIVGQTLVPAVVGLTVLGDTVASGREWAVAVGLVLAAGSAVA
ncbi:MAG: hypothetical protein WAW88_15725, partial [Nocardioides sp.]